jgi:hypothetical protein
MNTPLGYDRVRRRVYGGVLIFAVIVVISLAAIPALRARLLDRIDILRTAVSGEVRPPDITLMGESDIPYPEEFMRPASAAAVARPSAEPVLRRLPAVQPNVPSITLPVLSGTGAGDLAEAEEVEEAGNDEDSDLPRFLQGEIEREVYEKTLAANEKLAAMVQGGDPEFVFSTWGAARRDEGVYWVRVIFQNASGADVEYIWQTDPVSGRTVPLNFNARSL